MSHLMQMFGQTSWRSRAHCVWFRLCTVCLSVYISYAVYLSNSGLFLSPVRTVLALACFVLLSVGLYFGLTIACVKLARFAPRSQQREHMDARVFLAALVIALAVFGCTFAAAYPGGVNYDVSNQWRQAHSGEFNNWHPLMHTLLIWLATQVYDSYPFVVLVQILAFSAAMAWLTAVVHRCGTPGWLALGAHALAVLSSPVRNTLMYAGKDSAMTIGILLLTAWTIRILYTQGQWLRRPLHVIALGLTLALTTLLRHNAMLWTYTLIACLFLCLRVRKQAALGAAVMAVILLLIQGPLFGALDVVYPSNFVDESMGVPMTILGDVKQKEPEKLDAETNAFLETLATDEEWQTTYRLHNYNSIKFTFDREYVARRSVGDVLGMAAWTAVAAPRTAFEAVNGLTDLVWDITGQNEAAVTVRNSGHIESAAYGSAKLNQLGGYAVAAIEFVMNLPPLAWLTQNVGVQLLGLLLITLWALYRRGVRALVLALPTLLYHMGTMVLLASNDARFFQFAFAIFFACALALIWLPEEEDKCKSPGK